MTWLDTFGSLLTAENLQILTLAALPGLLVALLNVIVGAIRGANVRRYEKNKADRTTRALRVSDFLAALAAQAEATSNPSRNAQRRAEIETNLRTSRILLKSILTTKQSDLADWIDRVSAGTLHSPSWADLETFEDRIATPLIRWIDAPSRVSGFQDGQTLST